MSLKTLYNRLETYGERDPEDVGQSSEGGDAR